MGWRCRWPTGWPQRHSAGVALTGGNAHGAGVVVAVVRIAHGSPGGGVGCLHWHGVGQQVQQRGLVGAQALGPRANHCFISTHAQVLAIGFKVQSGLQGLLQ